MKKQNMIIKTIGLLLITLIGLGFANAKEMQPNDVINFPDKNFEKAIREKIRKHKGDILYSDISEITNVYFDNKGIKSIEGIQYFKSLYSLNLYGNEITDISPLKSLAKLWLLNLSKNNITDISALKSLAKLWLLNLSKNNITDISPLKNLDKLEKLWLSENKIIDISPLKNLDKLSSLGLRKNNITDYSALSSLPKLNQIYFDKGDIVDIVNYSKLKNMFFVIEWKNSKGKRESREIQLDKIKHLGKVTLDDEFISKYAKKD